MSSVMSISIPAAIFRSLLFVGMAVLACRGLPQEVHTRPTASATSPEPYLSAGFCPALPQPEGIVVYDTDGGAGYYVCTDQDMADNTFHVFDRETLAHAGAFKGAVTANTDGIALDRTPVGEHTEGLFIAVHDDGNIAAFDWRAIAERLKLSHRVAAPDSTATP